VRVVRSPIRVAFVLIVERGLVAGINIAMVIIVDPASLDGLEARPERTGPPITLRAGDAPLP
jgi:hypothetical protein